MSTLLLLLLLCFHVNCIEYSAIIPKTLFSDEKIQFSVGVVGYDEPIYLDSELYSKTSSFTRTNHTILTPERRELITLGKVPLDYEPDENLTLSFKGVDKKGNIWFQNKFSNFRFSHPKHKVIIQHDKENYTPGETVSLRVINISPDMKPVNHLIALRIFNSDFQTFYSRQQIFTTDGVFSDEFELPQDSIEGKWWIHLHDEQTGKEIFKFFNVKNFELRKTTMNLHVYHPKYVTSSSKGIEINVETIGSDGLEIMGKAKIEVYQRSDDAVEYEYEETRFNMRKNFFIPIESLRNFGLGEDFHKTIYFLVKVTDQKTLITKEYEGSFEYTKDNIRLQMLSMHKYVVNGVPYTSMLKITDYEGNQIPDEVRKNLKAQLKVKYSQVHGSDERFYEETHTIEISSKGFLPVNINFTNVVTTNITFELKVTMFQYNVTRISWKSQPSRKQNNYLKLTLDHERTGTGPRLYFNVATYEQTNNVGIIVIKDGKIMKTETIISDNLSYSFEYILEVKSEMQPEFVLIASYFTNGQLISDYYVINVNFRLPKKIQISPSHSSSEPGDFVKIYIRTNEPSSFVGLKTFEKYTSSPYSKNDFVSTKSNVIEDGATSFSFKSEKIIRRTFCGMLKELDVVVLTNAVMCLNDDLRANEEQEIITDIPAEEEFSQTWLWMNQFSDNTGLATYRAQVPPRESTWVLSAFDLSTDTGLDISNTAEVKVQSNFYVYLDLPSVAVKEEIVLVKATVKNGYTYNITVFLTFNADCNYELLRFNQADFDNSVTINVEAQTTQTIVFPVRFASLGTTHVVIEARTRVYYKSTTGQIYIKPKGIRHSISKLALFDGKNLKPRLRIEIPENIVEGSFSANLFISGDITRHSVKFISSLFIESHTAIEYLPQSFANNVFVIKYLENKRFATPEWKKKAYRKITDQFQRVIGFLKFPELSTTEKISECKKTIRTTAFILLTLKQMMTLQDIQTLPDCSHLKTLLVDSESFLLDYLNLNTNSSDTKTNPEPVQDFEDDAIEEFAYLSIALLEESTIAVCKLKNVMVYLEKRLSYAKQKPHLLALVTYALHLLESSKSTEAFLALKASEWTEGEYSHIYVPQVDQLRPGASVSMVAIETNTYALLTFALHHDVTKVSLISKWLLSEAEKFKIDKLSYYSIYATSKAEEVIETINPELLIQITQNLQTNYLMDLNEKNMNSRNLVEVEPIEGILDIKANGNGVAEAELLISYNIDSYTKTSSSFECSLSIDEEDDDFVTVSVCCDQNNLDQSEELIFEILPPSGYQVVDGDYSYSSYQERYFEEMYYDNEPCMVFKLKFMVLVKSYDKYGIVKINDQYNSGESLEIKFTFKRAEDLYTCSNCKGNCIGCPVQLSWESDSLCWNTCSRTTFKKEPRCYDRYSRKRIDINRCNYQHSVVSDTCDNPVLPVCPSGGGEIKPLDKYLPHLLNESEFKIFFRSVGGQPKYVTSFQLKNWIPGNRLSRNPKLSSVLATNLSSSLISTTNQFTISFLLYLEDKTKRTLQIVYIGEPHKKALLNFRVLSKNSTRLASLKIRHNNINYFVSGIDTEKWTDQWIHLTITWNVNKALVYMNGVQQGKSKNLTPGYTSTSDISTLSKSKMMFGQTSTRRGVFGFNGYISSILTWNVCLNQQQVEDTFKIYEDLLQTSNSGKRTILEPYLLKLLISPLRFN